MGFREENALKEKNITAGSAANKDNFPDTNFDNLIKAIKEKKLSTNRNTR